MPMSKRQEKVVGIEGTLVFCKIREIRASFYPAAQHSFGTVDHPPENHNELWPRRPIP